ncbi:DNA polymerase III subunit chi [Chelatococcus sp. SYSU_G07232]|uniref:DNA polymerase III subunit chi n=1 Tax=Chelatococcus albus TaxID=3047466 RepID=A0ABT7AJY8_9HYPH|nr:DNA polymerase III subunit chi [Chelatococcus sp. SYSU_G07232]MDJ1159687.1 DNA polymerase III subunit chi [Chelatococcus sp. SYSU_G07232]
MTDVLFYHLQRQPLEAVLPTLVEKSLERGWRAVIEVPAQERLAALDDHLWTYSDAAFLPHGTDRDPDAAEQPVVLTTGAGNPNGAAIRFLVDGAGVPDDAAAYERLVVLFNGNDEEALARARDEWRKTKVAGHAATYWQQDENGRWQKKA